MADINLTVAADLSRLTAQLEQIPGLTKDQATAMVKELERGFKGAEAAAKKSADATTKAMQASAAAAKTAANANKDLEDKFGKVGSSASKVAGVLDLLAPGLGDVARGVADVADGMEVASAGGSSLALGLGVVGLAMGAISLATQHYAEALDEVEQKNAKLAATASKVAADVERLKNLEDDITTSYRVATGAMTEEQAAMNRGIKTVQETMKAQREAAMARFQAAQAAGDSTDAQKAELKVAGEALTAITKRETAMISMVVTTEQARTKEAKSTLGAAAASRAKAEADRAAEAALRARNEAAKEALALMEEESRAQEQARSITDSLTESTQARARASLKGADAVTAAMEHELAQTLARYQEGTRAAGANSATQIELTRAYEAEVESIRQEAHDKRLALIDDEKKKQAAADAAALEVQKAAIMQGIGLITDSLSASADNQAAILEKLTSQLESNSDSMTEADKRALKERIAAQRDAAMLTFGINKAAQLATATVNTATAVTAALASAPPPANLIAAGVAGAAGAVQVAAIASQQPAFHSGGMVPDEVPARLVTGEAVLSRVGRNVIGDEQIRAANAGIAPPVKVVAINQYRHEVFRPFIRDHLRLGGDLSSAIRGTRTVGQREAL